MPCCTVPMPCRAVPGCAILFHTTLGLVPRHAPGKVLLTRSSPPPPSQNTSPWPGRSRAGSGGERPGSWPGMGEASDTDSGIMLHSGPDSPVSPLKERAQAGRRQQQALEARLEGCVQELRRLCLREAELTGTLPLRVPPESWREAPQGPAQDWCRLQAG
ncbi:unnamed protein product [Bubo scandiacus]